MDRITIIHCIVLNLCLVLKAFDVAGMDIFLFDPPWQNNMLGEKNDWNGMKKVGQMHIFPQLVKLFIFFPNWLKMHKIAQKKAENFSAAAPST